MNDEEIIQQIKVGHTETYGNLIRKYNNKVFGYCISMLFNRTDAEEAVQDIFVKTYYGLGRFKGNSTFSTWLYRITANHCKDILRMRNRRKTESLDFLIETKGSQIEELFASDLMENFRMENRDLADKLLDILPTDYRMILTLREVNGLECREIAAILGCTLDAVKGRLKRARQCLLDNFGQFMETEHNLMKKESDRALRVLK